MPYLPRRLNPRRILWLVSSLSKFPFKVYLSTPDTLASPYSRKFGPNLTKAGFRSEEVTQWPSCPDWKLWSSITTWYRRSGRGQRPLDSVFLTGNCPGAFLLVFMLMVSETPARVILHFFFSDAGRNYIVRPGLPSIIEKKLTRDA